MRNLVLSLCMATSSLGFSKDLTCTYGGSTSITWEPYKKEWQSSEKLSKDPEQVIKLINIADTSPKAGKPALVGNLGAAELSLISTMHEAFAYLELTPGGTPVVWTYFPKSDRLPADTIISTKAYGSMGPSTYTTMSQCK